MKGQRRQLILLVAALAGGTQGCSRAASSPERPAPLPLDLPTRIPAVFPAEWRFRSAGSVTFARNGMVTANDRLGAEVGAEVLRRGGNAVDAAVAMGFALAVTFPEAGNLGGGGYMVIRLADGSASALDYRETAPRAATRNMYLDENGRLTHARLVGPLASGVPGSVAGLSEALRRHGTMSLRDVIAPAIRLASEGFIVDSAVSAAIVGERELLANSTGFGTFFPGGAQIAAGARLVQPELAATLRLISRGGSREFYSGRIADQIVREMSRGCSPAVKGKTSVIPATKRCGIITRRDLAEYRPVWRRPIRSTYRNHAIISMPPSSSGGITLAESLNILENFESVPPTGSAAGLHRLRQVFQRAFIDRNARLGDPGFANIPAALLTSKAYAAGLRKEIDTARATPTPEATKSMREGTETIHYSVVDKWGNAVATTTTINAFFGSGVTVTGAGFFLNNTMDDFAAEPGKPNLYGLVQGEVNAVAPGKRALSAMTPTIVLDPQGQLFMVVGGRGGPRIITATAQVILNAIDHRMSLRDALNAPRIHYQALPDSMRVEIGGFSPALLDSLSAMGHALLPLTFIGGRVNAIMRVPGGWEGMDDSRSAGAAVGY